MIVALLLAAAPGIDLCAVALEGPYRESLVIDGTCSLARGPYEVCDDVVRLAEEVGVDPKKALALAFHEGRLRALPSFTGRRMLRDGVRPDDLPDWVERTTMQCKPRDHCPGGDVRGCDFLRACMLALKRELDHPRRCRRAPRYKDVWPFGQIKVGHKVVCKPVGRGARPDERLLASYARYHMPYDEAGAYAVGAMKKYDRLRTALKRARRIARRER